MNFPEKVIFTVGKQLISLDYQVELTYPGEPQTKTTESYITGQLRLRYKQSQRQCLSVLVATFGRELVHDYLETLFLLGFLQYTNDFEQIFQVKSFRSSRALPVDRLVDIKLSITVERSIDMSLPDRFQSVRTVLAGQSALQDPVKTIERAHIVSPLVLVGKVGCKLKQFILN